MTVQIIFAAPFGPGLWPGPRRQTRWGGTRCVASPLGASHLGQISLTAPNEDASTWNLANPNG